MGEAIQKALIYSRKIILAEKSVVQSLNRAVALKEQHALQAARAALMVVGQGGSTPRMTTEALKCAEVQMVSAGKFEEAALCAMQDRRLQKALKYLSHTTGDRVVQLGLLCAALLSATSEKRR